jgi:HK97 family phage major capsid protein
MTEPLATPGAPLSTSSITLPRVIADGMVKQAVTGSTVAALTGREPMRFGNVDIITFTDVPKAEFVEEGAQKTSTTAGFGVVTAKPHKAQVTMRFSEEVQWADQDYQLGVLSTLADAGATALARALDLGLYYRINPLSGTETAWTNYLNLTTLRHEIATAGADIDVETAAGLVIGDGYQVNGIALDPSYAWTLATARYTDGRKKFPELGWGQGLTTFNGLTAAVSNTVSCQPEAADNKVRAIIGDFQSGIRWGVQRDIPVETIKFGDPDGGGDLKRHNQIALRLEIVYGWYVFPARFAVIEDKA